MSFVDSPHYAWVMSYLWGIKHLLQSLGTAEVVNPKLKPYSQTKNFTQAGYVESWDPVFNGVNGPYMLMNLWFNYLRGSDPPQYFYGNHVRITVDGEMVYETGGWGINDTDLTRYVGRDGEWAPFFFAQDTLLVETRPAWDPARAGEIECVIMRFTE